MTPTPVLAPDSIDAMRSLRRMMSFVLDDDWDLAWTRTEDMARPCGVIVPIGPERHSGSAYVRDVERDFQMYLYPSGYEGAPETARMDAEQVALTVSTALERGNADAGSKALRVPLYDYRGIPVDEGQPVGAQPYGYLVLRRSFTIEPRVDPDDSDLFTVIVVITASWRVDGDRSRFEGTTLQDVPTQPPAVFQVDV